MKESRLSRKVEKKARNSIAFTVIAMLAILFLLFKFGIPFFANATLFISGSNDEIMEKKEMGFIAAPMLDSTFIATHSAQIDITGTSLEKGTIRLYLNDELIDDTKVDKNSSFSFEEIRLTSGENTIKAKIITTEKKQSEYSNELTILFKTSAPSLTIEQPSDNHTFSKDSNPVEVKGKTDAGVKVYVNDFWAIVDSSGNFSYSLRLLEGDNTIKVKAVDEAGNTTDAERKVKLSS